VTEDGELLLITLDLAVPMEIERLRSFTTDERVQLGHRLVDIIAAEGDNLLYLGHKKGDTARVFAAVATGLAALAYAPGGVKFAGRRWEA
jgi:hypothetical protein